MSVGGGAAFSRAGADSLRGAFNRLVARFAGAGIDSATLDARLLICHAAGLSHEQFIAEPGHVLSADAARRLDEMAQRRLAGWPLARITGMKEFWGRQFALAPETLVPRPDSELLVETGLAELAGGVGAGKARLGDLGTGSGCLLVSLLADFGGARGIGFDLSQGALACAAANAARHRVAGRALFVRADWLAAAAPESLDLIVANPPYIPSGEIAGLAREVCNHDPRAALDGGLDGLADYRRISAQAREKLAPGGALLTEVGIGQADAVAALFAAHGLTVAPACDILCDMAGVARVVRARRKS